VPARSQSQQRLFGMVHAYQSGKLDKPPAKIQSVAEHISPQSAYARRTLRPPRGRAYQSPDDLDDKMMMEHRQEVLGL
jgi:hypothetical protein